MYAYFRGDYKGLKAGHMYFVWENTESHYIVLSDKYNKIPVPKKHEDDLYVVNSGWKGPYCRKPCEPVYVSEETSNKIKELGISEKDFTLMCECSIEFDSRLKSSLLGR